MPPASLVTMTCLMLGPHHLLDRFFKPVLSNLVTAGRLQYLNLVKIKQNLQFSSSNAQTHFKGSVATGDEQLVYWAGQIMGHFHPQFHYAPLPPLLLLLISLVTPGQPP